MTTKKLGFLDIQLSKKRSQYLQYIMFTITTIFLLILSVFTVVDKQSTLYQLISQIIAGVILFWVNVILVMLPLFTNISDFKKKYLFFIIQYVLIVICTVFTIYKNTHTIEYWDDFKIIKIIIGTISSIYSVGIIVTQIDGSVGYNI